MSRISFLAFLPFLLAAEPADLIIHHAKVVTLDAKSTVAEAIAFRDGTIVAVGEEVGEQVVLPVGLIALEVDHLVDLVLEALHEAAAAVAHRVERARLDE